MNFDSNAIRRDLARYGIDENSYGGCGAVIMNYVDALDPESSCAPMAASVMQSVLGLSLFIVACVGASGGLSGVAIGWTSLGIAGAGFIAAQFVKSRTAVTVISSLLAAALPVILGSLGVAGVLTGVQVGWGLLIPTLISIGLVTLCCYSMCCCGGLALLASTATAN